MVSINIKSSSEKAVSVNIELTQTVADLKALIAEKLPDYPKDHQLLIYSGRVLKDEEPLTNYKVVEGNTIHVVKSAPRKPPSSSSSTSASSTTANAPSATTPSSTTTTSHATSSPPTATNPTSTPMNPFAQFAGMGIPGMPTMPNMSGMPPPNIDPGALMSLLNNPAIAQMMSQMLQNPQFMEAMMQSNPLMQGNSSTPELRQSIQSMLSNPNLLQSMFPMMANNGPNPNTTTPGSTNPSPMMPSFANLASMASLFPTTNPTSNPPTSTTTPSQTNVNVPPPEERFATQLQQLNEMGFYSPTANLRALQLTGGNVNAAIEWLLNNPDL